MRCLLASVVVLLAGFGQDAGARVASLPVHTEFLKLVFNAEGAAIVTSGCVRVQEGKYASDRWWSAGSDDRARPDAERSLASVLSAFVNKDRESLFRLSDPALRTSPNFDRQAGAFFQQFGVLTIKEIPRSVQMDSLVVFFVVVEASGKVSSVPLSFRKVDDHTLWFLPFPPQSLEYELVKGWFRVIRSAGHVEELTCSAAEVRKALYRVPLSSEPMMEEQDRSYLYLVGSSADHDSTNPQLVSRVGTALEHLKAALSTYDGREPLAGMGVEGSRRLREWWATASEDERKGYTAAIAAQEASFVFDLNPLFVLFTKHSSEQPRVMYFLSGQAGDLLWVNSSFGSSFDRIFKDGALYRAAIDVPPFKSLVSHGAI